MDRSDRGAWGDAVDEINRLRQQVANLRAALAPFAEQVVRRDMTCHVGICPPEKCGRCAPILNAQRVLAATQPQREEKIAADAGVVDEDEASLTQAERIYALRCADFVVDLREDGTYGVIKHRHPSPQLRAQNRRVYGVFPRHLLKLSGVV